jgi:hypothetical protein
MGEMDALEIRRNRKGFDFNARMHNIESFLTCGMLSKNIATGHAIRIVSCESVTEDCDGNRIPIGGED